MAKRTLTLSTLLAIVLLAVTIIGCVVLHSTDVLSMSPAASIEEDCDCDITQ